MNMENAEDVIDKLNIGMNKKTEEEAEDFLKKVNDVSSMLGDLMSNDNNRVKQAENDIDVFLEKQEKENQDNDIRKQYTAGCKTVEDRTVLNNKVVSIFQ